MLPVPPSPVPWPIGSPAFSIFAHISKIASLTQHAHFISAAFVIPLTVQPAGPSSPPMLLDSDISCLHVSCGSMWVLLLLVFVRSPTLLLSLLSLRSHTLCHLFLPLFLG